MRIPRIPRIPKITAAGKRIAAFVLLALAVVVGFAIQNSDRQNAKTQACLGILENRQLLADVIGNSQAPMTIDPSLSPELQTLIAAAQQQQRDFLRDTQEKFSKPVGICESVHIDSRIILRDKLGVELVPFSSTLPSSTTTTGSSSQGAQGERGPPGVAGPAGPAGPPGSTVDSSSSEVTTTTTPPTTTTPICLRVGSVIIC